MASYVKTQIAINVAVPIDRVREESLFFISDSSFDFLDAILVFDVVPGPSGMQQSLPAR